MKDPGTVIWFTGLAGSGKSTIATVVEAMLAERDLEVSNLDADEVRQNLSPNLGFSLEARDENTKRLAWMGKMLSKHGVNVVIAAVATMRKFRDRARELVPRFVEVYVYCPLEVCQERDPKGLYARRSRGEINDVDGIDIPYEEPLNAEVTIDTSTTDIETGAKMVIAKLEELGYI